jgi:hypothetical protein
VIVTYHLAQVNVGRLRAPVDAPETAEFIAALPEINALAEASPGFVWRLVGDVDDDATAVDIYDDKMIIVNASVWESVEALRAYVYDTLHVTYLRRRREWFEQLTEAYTALWWVPAGHQPTVAELRERLDLLRANGPTPEAFTLRQPFPAPDAQPSLDAQPAADARVDPAAQLAAEAQPVAGAQSDPVAAG